MMNTKPMEPIKTSDADLVAQSLGGSREAFGWIVARYQSLICALNYSATGNLSQSEDIAQETFLTAWKELGQLREPAKLRSWLCQISRNQAFDELRKQGREPSHEGENLDTISESQSSDPSPAERAISKEEQDILWRSLERIPQTYREPLILFYREHQSVEAVAVNLELSEEAVKQRLSRGRKLLSEEVTAFVEGALKRTSPGNMFTVGVMAALPSATAGSKAAALGMAAAKGAGTAKAAGLMGLIGAAITPFLSLFTVWISYRTSMDTAFSVRERAYNKRFFRRLVGSGLGFFVLYFILVFCFPSLVTKNHLLFVGLLAVLVLAFVIATAFYSIEAFHLRKKLLANLTPEELATMPEKPMWEYRSRFELLGLPFVHFRIGDRLAPPVKAWIAGGDCAFGLLFAFGGLAIAPISLGGCAIGIITFGGLAIGALVLGGTGVGGWVFAGLGFGWQVFGGCAIAWNAAWGGYAIAHQFAIGGIVHAAQANNNLAVQIIQANPFFRISGKTLPYLFWLNMIWFVPVMFGQRIARRAAQVK